ncbi:hypothetical protein C0Q70_08372 [Pomacea canaliculata]|uniref:Peptidase M14 domain-containing protein n=1 Tax=Pomacea canaliculata TaxID=400727 RepID=A0A2T7PHM8_POMCA|nr:hypothetical protein C0Q70_08372 [Pomacea canaliculata]
MEHPKVSELALTSLPLLLVLLLAPEVGSLDFNYHDAGQLETFLKEIARTYPSLTHVHSIGKSVKGADLWVIVIGESAGRHVLLRPNVKCIANMHGNEAVGREELLHLVEYLVTNYGKDPTITNLLNTTTIHLMPTMNPDGFAAANATDCKGVQGRLNAKRFDLNRNFPGFFQKMTDEIQKKLLPSLTGSSRHSSRGARASRSPDDDVFVHLAKTYSFAHPTMNKGQPCFPGDDRFPQGITNGAQWYPVNGGMQDYNYIEASCYELTVENSCCKYPPANRLPTFWEADRKPLLDLLQKVHMGVKGLVLDEDGNAVYRAVVIVEGREQVPFRTSKYGEFWKLLLPGDYNLMKSW